MPRVGAYWRLYTDLLAQADVIENQSALNEKWAARVTELEKALSASRVATETAEERAAAAAAPPALEGKLDGKTSTELRGEVLKLRTTLKEKEEQRKFYPSRLLLKPSHDTADRL